MSSVRERKRRSGPKDTGRVGLLQGGWAGLCQVLPKVLLSPRPRLGKGKKRARHWPPAPHQAPRCRPGWRRAGLPPTAPLLPQGGKRGSPIFAAPWVGRRGGIRQIVAYPAWLPVSARLRLCCSAKVLPFKDLIRANTAVFVSHRHLQRPAHPHQEGGLIILLSGI